jgi:Na+-driven multidrug efflux pump
MSEHVTEHPEAAPAPTPTPAKMDRRLIDGAVAPTLVRFAAPLLATNMMLSASGSWGSIWVSHVVGPDALTAMSNSWLFIMLMIGMVQGVGTTAGIAVAQAVGARDLDTAKRASANALVFAFVSFKLVFGLPLAFVLHLIYRTEPSLFPLLVPFRLPLFDHLVRRRPPLK